MSKGKNLARASVFCVLLMVATCFTMVVMAKQDDQKVRVIVTFNDKVDKDLIKKHGGSIDTEFSIIPAVVTELTQDEIKELKNNDKIFDVEEDAEAEIDAQTTPWGITQVKANQVWATTTGSTIKVAVMDTGIDTDHPDLQANIKGGTNVISGVSYEDDNGHGTHCAGIIAAVNNDLGIIGVGPNIQLYAIKALNKKGSGYYTDFIEGLQWAVDNGMDVVSMSFGGTSASTAFRDACANAKLAGIVLVASAGNSGNTRAQYPAAYPSVISVGATDNSDTRAKWSSYGSNLDLMAPGVSIYSSYFGNTYATLSGTSLSCPHVAGTVALVLTTSSTRAQLFGDQDGVWSPADVQDCLQKTATDLGAAGWDKYYGNGLVNAYEAVTGNHGT